MSSGSVLSEAAAQAKLRIRAGHVEQLRTFPLPSPEPVTQEAHAEKRHNYKQWLLRCSKESNIQIQQAISQQVLGGRTISWPLGLYAFMETVALYLRDYDTFIEAVKAAQAQEDERAFELLAKSEEAIEEVAEAWGMTFVVACDLVEKSPQGHPVGNGPFCGLFFPRQPTDGNACIGIAFKGTSLSDWFVNIHYRPKVAPNGALWNTHVSHGVYDALFNYYPDPKFVPYDHILNSLTKTGLLNPIVMVHTTGYSLGASYSSLFHMETVRRLGDSPFRGNFYIGDIYTFGSPRVGLDDWASAARTAMSAQTRGHAWRTANAGDLVTMVPPVFPWDAKFIHLDAGWQISPMRAPTKLPSEIGTLRNPPPPSSWNPNAHQTAQYYAALRNAIGQATGVPPPEHDVTSASLEIPTNHHRY